MDRRNLLSLSAMTVSGLALLPGRGVAALRSDDDKIKAVIDTFHAALGALDMKKMQDVWAHDPDVMLINPRDKALSIGWDAAMKNWQATFDFYASLTVTQQDGPHIHTNDRLAWQSGIVLVAGQPKSGNALSAPTFETSVLEKRGSHWLYVSHSAWRVPQ